MSGVPDALLILLLNIVSVILIVTGQRFEVERKLKKRYGIDRYWWIPPMALLLAFSLSILEWSSVKAAFLGKFDILALIFCFGILAEGLRRSGFFRHVAYKAVERSQGDADRLILYLFVLTSVATFFTANDIVVYVMTPIIVAICFETGIENTKLFLLSQFIAANTLSMGLLTGSPTNLIIADSMQLDFFTYLLLMFLPALISFTASLLILKFVIRILRSDYSFLEDLEFRSEYSVPEENPEPVFTGQMKNWVAMFGLVIASVSVVTYLQMSLLWTAVPAITIGLAYWHFSDSHEKSVSAPVRRLPYGIFFFGMTFFIFAEQFSRTGFVNQKVIPGLTAIFSGDLLATSFLGIYGSGFLVNVFNDLPASAMIAQVLPELGLKFPLEAVLAQASLIGLNLGTYITPIGALAGLIWFREMRLERLDESSDFPQRSEEMVFPGRTDLVKYGLLNFVFVGMIAGSFLTVEFFFLSLLQ